jgi:hypothetical protein
MLTEAINGLIIMTVKRDRYKLINYKILRQIFSVFNNKRVVPYLQSQIIHGGSYEITG